MRQLLRPCVAALIVTASLAHMDVPASTVLAVAAPSAPIAPEVWRHGGLAGTSATVRWTKPLAGPAPTTYVVAAIPHDGDPATSTAAVTVNVPPGDRSPTATLGGLTPGVTYDVIVTATGAGGSTTAVANPTTWLPSPGDGLVLWLDVSHPDTVTVDQGQVASLVDRSAAGNDTTTTTQRWMATGGHRGRAVTWGFPGLTNSDASQGTLQIPHHASLDHQGSYTVLMALHQTSAVFPVYAQFMFKATYLPQFGDCYATQYQLAKFSDPAELYGYHGNDGNTCSTFSRQSRNGITPTGDQVIGRRVRFDAGSNLSHSDFRRAGQWDASPSTAGRTPNSTAVMSLGTPHMSETLLFTTALTDASVSAIEAYLAAKAPLPAPVVTVANGRRDGFDLAVQPGHGSNVLAAGRYQVSLDGGVTWRERSDGYADSPLRFSGLAPGATVSVSVRAVSAAGYGAASTPMLVTVPVPDVSAVMPLTTQPASPTSTTPTSTPPEPQREPLSLERLAALPTGAVLTGGDTVLLPGEQVTLSGGGFVPGEPVQAVMASSIQVLGTAMADAAGTVVMDAALPTDATPGEHTLALYAPVSGRGLRQRVTVVATAIESTPPTLATPTPTPAPPQGELPATGGSSGASGVALVLMVGGLALLARRSRRPQRPTVSPAGRPGAN